MKNRIVIIVLCMISSIILLGGCSKSKDSDKQGEVTNKPTSVLTNSPTPTGVIAPTKSIAPTATIAPTITKRLQKQKKQKNKRQKRFK